MKISYIKAKLTEADVMSIIEDFVPKDLVDITEIKLDPIIKISGKLNLKYPINFYVECAISTVEKQEVVLKVLKVKCNKLRLANWIIDLAIKKFGESIEELGVSVKKGYLYVDLVKIQELIPIVNFNVQSLEVSNNSIELEGESIVINTFKEYKTIDEAKREKEVIRQKVRDKYTELRAKIEEGTSDKYKGFLPIMMIVPDLLAMLYRLFKDKRVSRSIKAMIAMGIGYTVMPIDLIPDFIPVLGSLDDIYVIFYIMDRVVRDVNMNILLDNFEGDEEVITGIHETIRQVFDLFGVTQTASILINIKEVIFNKFKRSKIKPIKHKDQGKMITLKNKK